ERITVDSNMVRSGTFTISFENVTIDLHDDPLFDIRMEGLKDTSEDINTEDKIKVSVHYNHSGENEGGSGLILLLLIIGVLAVLALGSGGYVRYRMIMNRDAPKE
ncbi:MAG: hypothetical protein U9R75_09600, partial [Candidatus Thermoplasmatota archaeon]|nr:hypothetical protein [Candidatus Thermoplasmatota archaeon]